MEKASRALLLRVPVLTSSEAPFRPTGGGLLPHPRVVLANGFTLSAASCLSWPPPLRCWGSRPVTCSAEGGGWTGSAVVALARSNPSGHKKMGMVVAHRIAGRGGGFSLDNRGDAHASPA